MKPSRLLSPEDRLRIETAIAAAERETEGELAVVVVQACDAYAFVPMRLGVLLAALVLLAMVAAGGEVPAMALLGGQALALGTGLLLGRLPAVKRHLVSEAVQDARVGERARRAFAEHGLQRTRRRTGILLFVTLLEHRVVVLADEGIHRALGPGERWEDVVALILDGIRSGRAADGLLAAIARCAAMLAKHLPPAPVAEDEIRNLVVLED